MRCYLRDYLALKQAPIIGTAGEPGRLSGMTFREPGWEVTSVLVELGRVTRLVPHQLQCTLGDVSRIEMRVIGERAREGQTGAGNEATETVEADELIGCGIVSSSDDAVGGRIEDLLVNMHEWRLKYLVIDNRKGRVLLHVSWVTGLSPETSSVIIDGLPAHALQSAPEYPGIEALNPGYEDTVYRHYTHREFYSFEEPGSARETYRSG